MLVLFFGRSRGQKAGQKKDGAGKKRAKKKMVRAKSGQKKDGAGKRQAKKKD